MPVVLAINGQKIDPRSYNRWIAINSDAAALPAEAALENLGARLEAAFDSIRDQWWSTAQDLQGTSSAELAHAACCNPSPSDFGAMLAWSALIRVLAAEPQITLAVCDDPWLFRPLSELPNVSAHPAPRLMARRLRLRARGFAARCRVAVRVAISAIRLGYQKRLIDIGSPALLVYGHPRSRADGEDAYFGRLMDALPNLCRVLHTDCRLPQARRLCGHERTVSLHAWGSPWFALAVLPWSRWRPTEAERQGASGWLVRRAADLEGARGAAAMTRWQSHCQARWLKSTRPSCVAWPWENQPWEKIFTRQARRRGARTLGYIHTVVGRHMWNQSPHANRDGMAAVPDRLLCNGPGYRRDLLRQGLPEATTRIAGAFRFQPVAPLPFDPAGPVFVALSSNLKVSAELMAAVLRVTDGDREFLIKDHPMYPFNFTETERVHRTKGDLYGQPPLSAVIYCASVVGLEAYLAGLPTLRFVPSDQPAVDVLPEGVELPSADANGLETALSELRRQPAPDWHDIFAPVDLDAWKAEMTETAAP